MPVPSAVLAPLTSTHAPVAATMVAVTTFGGVVAFGLTGAGRGLVVEGTGEAGWLGLGDGLGESGGLALPAWPTGAKGTSVGGSPAGVAPGRVVPGGRPGCGPTAADPMTAATTRMTAHRNGERHRKLPERRGPVGSSASA